MINELKLLKAIMESAEKLSSAMVESEAKGADYELVEEPWSNLTAEIQAFYDYKRLRR
jgi:hypothetical protein